MDGVIRKTVLWREVQNSLILRYDTPTLRNWKEQHYTTLCFDYTYRRDALVDTVTSLVIRCPSKAKESQDTIHIINGINISKYGTNANSLDIRSFVSVLRWSKKALEQTIKHLFSFHHYLAESSFIWWGNGEICVHSMYTPRQRCIFVDKTIQMRVGFDGDISYAMNES